MFVNRTIFDFGWENDIGDRDIIVITDHEVYYLRDYN